MEQLGPYIGAMIQNLKRDGLYRYDPSDISEYLTRNNDHHTNRVMQKGFQVLDLCSPITVRKILHTEKRIYATTFYHLGMAGIRGEQYKLCEMKQVQLSSIELAEMALDLYYDPETCLWLYPNKDNKPAPGYLSRGERPETMPMHGLARLNIFLLELWKHTKQDELLDIVVKSALATTRYHHITEYSNESAAISYFYDSFDNTLNVNSEFLQWIAEIPSNYRPLEVEKLGHKILKMLLLEQNQDGSFYYFGKDWMKSEHKLSVIDGHHTAYLLNNLIHVMDSSFVTDDERQQLQKSCIHGIEFFLQSLYNETTGEAIYQVNLIRRKADPVSYSEGIITFCSCLRSDYLPQSLKLRISKLLPKALHHLLSLINLHDGSAPSACIYGKWTHINSIRWGNGPALQAIFDYIAAEKDGLVSQ